MNHIKQLAGQTAVYGFGVVIPRLLSYLLLTPFYTRVFLKVEYGIITELYAYVVFLIVILTYGLETGFFRFADGKSNKDDVYKTSLISILLSSLLWVALVVMFYGGIAEVLDYGNNKQYILWLGLIVGLDAFSSVPFAKIRLENKALKYSIIRVVEVSVTLFFNWFFILYCHNHYQDSEWISRIYNPEIRVGYVLVSNLIASGIKIILLSKEIFSIAGKFDVILWRKILVYSFPLLIAGLAGTVNEALDRVLLKHLVSPPLIPLEQLGIYGASFKLAVLMTLFIQMFRYAAEPFFFSKMNDSNARHIYADVMKFFIFAGLLIFLLVMLYIDVFKLFIGKEFREAIGIVPIILVANLFMGIYYNLSVWFKLTNRTQYGAMMVIAGAIITIAINYFFIPKFNYLASAWGHFFAYLFMVLLSYFIGRKFYRIDYQLGRILGYSLMAIAIYLLFNQLTFENALFEYLLKTLSLLIYIGIFVRTEKLLIFKKSKNI